MDAVAGTFLGIFIAFLVLLTVVYPVIRMFVWCCQCLFGSRRRGADFGLHSPVPAATTFVVLNQNKEPVPVVYNVPVPGV